MGVGLGVLTIIVLLLILNGVEVIRGWKQLGPVASGRLAPDFTLPDSNAREVKLESLRGQVILLSFWASWCAPCLKEMPMLNNLQQELGAKGLKIVSINVDGNTSKVRQYAKKMGNNLTFLVDNGGVANRYGVQTLPHLTLIGRDGIIRQVISGFMNENRLRQELMFWLNQTSK